MRRRFQGWNVGLMLVGLASIGVAAAAAGDPPVTATPKKKTPTLLTPPSTKSANSESAPSATSDARSPSGAKPDAGPSAVQQISYEPTQGDSANLRPSTQPVASQFARQPSQPPEQPLGRDGQPPIRLGQPPESVVAPVGQVEVQGIDQLGVLILRGDPRDVEAMKKIIERIQEISATLEPYIRVFQLQRASATTVRDTILALYSGGTTTSSAPRPTTTQGGGGQAGGGQSSAVLQTSVLERFQVASDERSNTLIVQASPQMMEKISRLIERLDVDGAPVVNEIRVFQLKNAEAVEITNVLTQAIANTDASTTGATLGAATGGGGSQAGTVSGGGESRTANRTSVVRLVPLEGKPSSSGLLDEVRITAQTRTNSVIVSAPPSSMPLMGALIAELDKPPQIVATVKVFQLKNSDATNMRITLSELFDLEPTTGTAGGGGLGTTNNQFQRPIGVPGGGDNPPVAIRVAVDERTNSLIVSGPENALLSVEAVIRKLDLADIHNRRSTVYRLKNSQASDVALALTSFFTNKRTIEGQQAGGTAQQGTMVGIYQRLEQDVVVVALDNTLAAALTTTSATAQNPTHITSVNTQGVSNLLLISAAPRYYDQVMEMIEELDAAQPQVMIQVIIAQLTLDDNFEFGVELGFQNDVLFNRGDLAVNPLNPGFSFNNTGQLPNTNVFHPSKFASQGLSSLSLGRANMDGIGGLILSASSDSISALIRALQTNSRLEVLSAPKIMTLDGRTARVSVVDSIPYVGSVTQTQIAVTTPVSFINVGVTLTVKPNITPDNRIYLEVVPEVSELQQLVTFSSGTTTLIAPRTSLTTANTVVSVNDGQTIVLGGLIQNKGTDIERKIPWLGDLPYLGNLFKFTQHQNNRKELIVILTPHIVRGEADAQRIKDQEVSRVNWILERGPSIHGDFGLSEALENPDPACDLESLAPKNQPKPAVQQMSGIELVEPLEPVVETAVEPRGEPVKMKSQSAELTVANRRASYEDSPPATGASSKPRRENLRDRIRNWRNRS